MSMFTVRGPLALPTGTGFLLDTLGASATASYSSRKLRSAYGGSAFNVRTSAGGGTQDIGFDGSGNLDTASLAAFIGANNGTVHTWYDQSGSTNLGQATAANQPIVVSSGTNITQNGHVCPQGSNASQLLLSSSAAANQANTIAICFKLNSAGATTGTGALFTGTTTPQEALGAAGTHWSSTAGTPITGGTSDQTIHCGFAIFNGASSQFIIDGSVVASGNAGSNALSGLALFCDSAFTGIDANICEVLLFASSLSAGDQTLIRTSWQSYWGTP